MDNAQRLEQIEERLDRLLKDIAFIKRKMANYSHMPRDKPLNIDEAADYLKLSVSTIYKMVYAGKITALQRSSKTRLLFTVNELDLFLNNNNIKQL